MLNVFDILCSFRLFLGFVFSSFRYFRLPTNAPVLSHPPSFLFLSPLTGPSSKFRHIQGTVLHRDTHFTNLRGMSLTTPGECDGFCANGQRVAVPLAISGGQIAVLEVPLSQGG